jgi:hypothetical protein
MITPVNVAEADTAERTVIELEIISIGMDVSI